MLKDALTVVVGDIMRSTWVVGCLLPYHCDLMRRHRSAIVHHPLDNDASPHHTPSPPTSCSDFLY